MPRNLPLEELKRLAEKPDPYVSDLAIGLSWQKSVEEVEDLPTSAQDHEVRWVVAEDEPYGFMKERGWETLTDHMKAKAEVCERPEGVRMRNVPVVPGEEPVVMIAPGCHVVLKTQLCNACGNNEYIVGDGYLLCKQCGCRTPQIEPVTMRSPEEHKKTFGEPRGQTMKTVMLDEASGQLKALPLNDLLNRVTAAQIADMHDAEFMESTLRKAEDNEISELFSEAARQTGKTDLTKNQIMAALEAGRKPKVQKIAQLTGDFVRKALARPSFTRRVLPPTRLPGAEYTYTGEDPTKTKKRSLDELADLA